MNRSAALSLCAAALVLAAACPRRAAAQLYLPQAQRYLLTTDATDERAAWVNPAGLARRLQAALGADVTAGSLGGDRRITQYGASLVSHNLAAAWEHDRYPGGDANVYVVAMGLGDELLSAGAAHRWHQGGQGAWDVALRARATPILDASVVWRNIGSPQVRDSVYRGVFVPAAGLRLFGGLLTAGVEADLAQSLAELQEVRAGATLSITPFLSLALRASAGKGADRRTLSVVVEFHGQRSRGALAGIFPAGAGGLETLAASGALVAFAPPRTGRR